MTPTIRPALIAAISTALSHEICLNAPAAERLSNAALRAVADRLREFGLRVVPVEATEGMVTNARKHHEGEPYLPVSLYRAMLSAYADPLVELEDADA